MWRETFYSQSVHALLSGKNRANDLKHVKEFLPVLQFWGKKTHCSFVKNSLPFHNILVVRFLCYLKLLCSAQPVDENLSHDLQLNRATKQTRLLSASNHA